MRPTALRFAIGLSLAVVLACGAGVEGSGVEGSGVQGSSAWRTDSIWDDGNAEFCAYEVDWFRYGGLNPGRALLILVKEPWAPDLDVKADTPRPDGFDVLKLNHVRDVPTGIYTYNQMASVFVRRESGALQKLMATSSEGCGISTARMTGGTLETSSYFDGQGDRSMPYPDGVFAEDGLPMTLRGFVTGELPTEIEVFPSLMAGRYPDLTPRTWAVARIEAGLRSSPAGELETTEIRLTAGADWRSYLFAQQSPHLLLELSQSDGTTYRLAKCERIPYWQMNRPGGEEWLPETLR